LAEAVSIAIGVLATIVSVIATFVSLRALNLTRQVAAAQTIQAERIGKAVVNTTEAIDRYFPANIGESDEEYEPPLYSARLKAKFIRAGESIDLQFEFGDWNSPVGGSAVRCDVETPNQKVFSKELGFSSEIKLTYPRDFPGASNEEPGLYKVVWHDIAIFTSDGKEVNRWTSAVARSYFGVLP
jgi:hypothetical protein